MNELARVVADMTAGAADDLRDAKLGDLQLAYVRVGELRKSRIGRIDKPPTQSQVRAVLAAFGVPEDGAITAGRVKTQQPGTARWAVLRFAEVRWREVEHADSVPCGEARA